MLNYEVFLFRSAVEILLLNIEDSSFVSFIARLSSSIFPMSGFREMIFKQTCDSLSSFRQIFILWMKSFLDSALWASP